VMVMVIVKLHFAKSSVAGLASCQGKSPGLKTIPFRVRFVPKRTYRRNPSGELHIKQERTST
jgi:hypothetical protein